MISSLGKAKFFFPSGKRIGLWPLPFTSWVTAQLKLTTTIFSKANGVILTDSQGGEE